MHERYLPLSTRNTALAFIVLALPSLLFTAEITSFMGVLIRIIPVLFLLYISTFALRGLHRSMVSLGLVFFIVAVFLRIYLEPGGFLGWASAIMMGFLCYGISFWRYATLQWKQCLKVVAPVAILYLSQFWNASTYEAYMPAIWAMASVATFTALGAAMHKNPSGMIFWGGSLLLLSLVNFQKNYNGYLPSMTLEYVMLPYYAGQALVVFGYFNYQRSTFGGAAYADQ